MRQSFSLSQQSNNPTENRADHPDCPVCRATEQARAAGREPSLAELKKAFLRAKDQGAIVGGSWFEE